MSSPSVFSCVVTMIPYPVIIFHKLSMTDPAHCGSFKYCPLLVQRASSWGYEICDVFNALFQHFDKFLCNIIILIFAVYITGEIWVNTCQNIWCSNKSLMGCAYDIALYNFFWFWFTGVIGLDKELKVRIYNDGHSNGPIKINKGNCRPLLWNPFVDSLI